jgi:hypothetical protein
MAKFDFYRRQSVGLYSRYDEWPDLRGVDEWRRLVDYPSYEAFNEIRKIGPPAFDCPCLFVSHRQADADYAKRIAYLATTKNFKFWLDILDPGLQSLPNMQMLSEDQKRWLIAGIIEMGIINSTHVISLITSNTIGSMWVPYEYGRITGIPTVSGRACAWKHPGLQYYFPEYLLLGNVTQNEYDINNWLQAEMNVWRPINSPGKSNAGCHGSWEGDTPPELP